MKKRIMTVILTLAMCITLVAGCNQKTDETDSSDKLNIVTTIYAPYDFARAITKDNAQLSMLLQPGSEVHSFEPTPKDIIKIQNCDVFIYVGGENDEWVDEVLKSIDNKDMKVIKLLDIVDVVEEETVEGMEEEAFAEGVEGEEEGDGSEVEWDEHVWTSPVNAIKICNAFKDTFCEIDPEHKDDYEANENAYVEKLQELDSLFKEAVDGAKRNTVVFGDRFPLRYFVEEYGLEYYAAFPGCAQDTEASAATIAFLTDKVKEEGIPVVFKIELSNGNMADTIAKDGNAKVLTFYSCHNVTKEDFDNGLTYVDFMEKNVESLKEALN